MRVAVRVCVPGYGHYWLWVVTYDTRAGLKAAAEQYMGHELDMSTEEEDGILGCFSGNSFTTNYLGIMRLYDVSMETIIHESVHAAICLAGKRHGRSRTVSNAKEETIAYGTESIAVAVADAVMGSVP